MRQVLVVAPHPDDEVLGAGGSLARLAEEGALIDIAIVTRGYPPEFDSDLIEVGRGEARKAHSTLGVHATHFLDFPAAGLDTVPHREVNAALLSLVEKLSPDTVFLPFQGDLHLDHQLISHSTLVATRPNHSDRVRRILAYETPSETNWGAPGDATFVPSVFVDISRFLDCKLEALACFASQMRPFPHARSLDSIRALAQVRGSTVGVHAAEAFMLVREIHGPDESSL
jgi:N-acetylglucosamine malate deacetylase 1